MRKRVRGKKIPATSSSGRWRQLSGPGKSPGGGGVPDWMEVARGTPEIKRLATAPETGTCNVAGAKTFCAWRYELRPHKQIMPLPLPQDERDIQRVGGWRRVVFEIIGRILHLWGRSLHFEVTPEDKRALFYHDVPIALTLWHNRLFLGAEIFRRFRRHRPVHALISSSKDGAWLEAFFEIVGMRAVRGSSSRGGREAATALVDVLRQGNDIGITPDGPRGPCYEVKPGALIVARRAHTPMLLLGGIFESAWRLRSWDRFFLPKPFSRVRVIGEIIDLTGAGPREKSIEILADRLKRINRDDWPPPSRVI